MSEQTLWRRVRPTGVSAWFEPRDLWVGVFWEHGFTPHRGEHLKVYVCLVPCLPVLFTFGGRRLSESSR